MAKPDIATKVNLTLKFYTALGKYDDEEALSLFKRASLGLTGILIQVNGTPNINLKSV